MILDLMDKKIKEMKTLQRLRLKKQNQDQQAATDAKYKYLVSQVKIYISVYDYTQKNFGFNISTELKNGSRQMLIKLQEAIQDGDADRDLVESADKDFKSLKTSMTKEWKSHFEKLASDTISTLNIISGLNSEKVRMCLIDIKAADKWSLDMQLFIKLKNALDTATALINSLGLEPPIIAFLKKMTSGSATIEDLDETILSWIAKERMGNKIKLSFQTK